MAKPVPMPDRGLRTLGCSFGIVNAVLWVAVVPIADGWDRLLGRLDVPGRPHHIFGSQELLVYFDPWMALVVLPIVYTAGFESIRRAPMRGTPLFVPQERRSASL